MISSEIEINAAKEMKRIKFERLSEEVNGKLQLKYNENDFVIKDLLEAKNKFKKGKYAEALKLNENVQKDISYYVGKLMRLNGQYEKSLKVLEDTLEYQKKNVGE